jgi:hypothetical protein
MPLLWTLSTMQTHGLHVLELQASRGALLESLHVDSTMRPCSYRTHAHASNIQHRADHLCD